MRQDPAVILTTMHEFPELVDPAAWAFWWGELERQAVNERPAGRIQFGGIDRAERPSSASVPRGDRPIRGGG